MQKSILACIIILMIASIGICSAEEMKKGFNGTWINYDNVLVLSGDGQNIIGTFDKNDGSVLDMTGILSDDGKVVNGTWVTEGKFTFILSDDDMSFNGTYGYIANDTIEGIPATVYVREDNASIEKDARWNGTWTFENGTWANNTGILFLIQNGNNVTGREESGDVTTIIQGTVSDDGKVLSGDWNLTGLYSFTISEDESFFNGTFGYGSDISSYPWDGVRIE
jgi:hypothetical protein